MIKNTKKHFCFILPSLFGGGMERVMVEIAHNFIRNKNAEVTFILLSRNKRFYDLDPAIQVIEPPVKYNKNYKILFTLKTLLFTREAIKKINPDIVLSFGEKWNSFNILLLLFTKYKLFVSDRSSPKLKLSIMHKILRGILYRKTIGIIAQTSHANAKIFSVTNHKNIITIGNPIRNFGQNENIVRENIIVNVGRFETTKQQIQLIEIFAGIKTENWKLVLIGNGRCLEAAKNKVKLLGIENKVDFTGEVKNVDDYYKKSKIFAFTSILEGFPNALAEALATPLACISYDCSAGPADLITDNNNGYLIEENNISEFRYKLELLMNDEQLRTQFEQNAMLKIKEFSSEDICDKYYSFLTSK
ncbi:MAG: glycosyltransferase [Bacteroidia bacterium]|nr:glycosyltransferase [Bacteroidia bacterium]